MAKKKTPKFYNERLRLTYSKFGKKSERDPYRVRRRTKDGFATWGVNKKGFKFYRREYYTKSTDAKMYVEKVRKRTGTIQRGEKFSLTAQFYVGRIKHSTGKLLQGKTGTIIRSTQVTVKKRGKKKGARPPSTARWTKTEADKKLDFLLSRIIDWALEYQIRVEEEEEEQTELFDKFMESI